MKYQVIVQDFGLGQTLVRRYRKVTLPKAQRLVTRAIRRGIKRFGGNIDHQNFGGNIDHQNFGGWGGVFPRKYRSAIIEVDSKGRTLC